MFMSLELCFLLKYNKIIKVYIVHLIGMFGRRNCKQHANIHVQIFTAISSDVLNIQISSKKYLFSWVKLYFSYILGAVLHVLPVLITFSTEKTQNTCFKKPFMKMMTEYWWLIELLRELVLPAHHAHSISHGTNTILWSGET
jgi:hypothetical protein